MGLVIAVDFDGTCVSHEFPKVGYTVPGVVNILRRWIGQGHKLILLTMRDQDFLEQAIDWFESHKIPLYGINENPDQHWTTSRKVYADLYVDDAAVGVPLIYPGDGGRPYVNWPEVDDLVQKWHHPIKIQPREVL